MNPLVVIRALDQVSTLSRREMTISLLALRQSAVGLSDIFKMKIDQANQWFGWNGSQWQAWESARDIELLRYSRADETDVHVITVLDVEAPAWLLGLPATPWLFFRGELAILDGITLGFSGQRDAGEEALAISASLATRAALLGFTVVSGGARGVDMCAHTAALAADGTTVVVLPQGIQTWKPPLQLVAPKVASRVLVISEDLPGEPWNRSSAMRRNRLIVDLSRIFVIPQSGTSGGSHSTGMLALKQGRVTYVPDLGPEYPGNRKLLSLGAKPLARTGDASLLETILSESTSSSKPEQVSLF